MWCTGVYANSATSLSCTSPTSQYPKHYSYPMSAKKSAALNTGYPIFGIKFIDNKTVLAVGGGGEGNNGIPNKITAVKCSLKVKDKERRLQKYREITLPSNEDSPMCVDAAGVVGDDGNKNSIFVGCNQSSALIKNMNVNNNLRKYGFTDEEHLKFLDAVQFDNTVLAESAGEYPKIISLSRESEVGALMTSQTPSEVYIFRPENLELVAKTKASTSGEIKDLQVSQHDGGKSVCLVTTSTVEVINTQNGVTETVSSGNGDNKSLKILAKYNLSKLRFVSDSNVVIVGALKSGKGIGIILYDVVNHKVVKESKFTKKSGLIVAMDVSQTQNLIAVAGNDLYVHILRLSDLKLISSIPKLHKFAITSLSFSPSGTKLASGSADQTLNVMPIPPNYASGTSIFGFIFKLLMFFFVIGAGIFVQQALQAGQLDQYIDLLEQHVGPLDHYVDLSKRHGGELYNKAQVYGKVAVDLSQKYGSVYYEKAQVYGKIGYEVLKEKSAYGLDLIKEKLNQDKLDDQEDTKQFFTMTDWADKPEVQTETETTAQKPDDTLNDFVSEVTKAVDDLTYAEGEIDTESIIREAVKLDTNTLNEPVSSLADVSHAEELKKEVSSEAPQATPEAASTSQEPVAEPVVPREEQAEETPEAVQEPESALTEESSIQTPAAETPILETPPIEESIEPSEASSEEPESFAGTVLEDVGEVEEPTDVPVDGEAEDLPTPESAEFEKVDPEVVIEEEVTPEASVVEQSEQQADGSIVDSEAGPEPTEPEIQQPEVALETGSAEESSIGSETETVIPEASVQEEDIVEESTDSVNGEVNSETAESSQVASETDSVVPVSSEVVVLEPIEEPIAESEVNSVPEETEELSSSLEETEQTPEPSSESDDILKSIETPVSSVIEKVEESVVEPVVENVVKPVTEAAGESFDSVTEAASESINSITEAVSESIESATEAASQPIDSVVEPVVESVESAAEPVIESVAEPVVESVVEPVVESVVESVVEPVIEPTTESAAEPIKSAEEPVEEPVKAAEEPVQVSDEPASEPVQPVKSVKEAAEAVKDKATEVIDKAQRKESVTTSTVAPIETPETPAAETVTPLESEDIVSSASSVIEKASESAVESSDETASTATPQTVQSSESAKASPEENTPVSAASSAPAASSSVAADKDVPPPVEEVSSDSSATTIASTEVLSEVLSKLSSEVSSIDSSATKAANPHDEL